MKRLITQLLEAKADKVPREWMSKETLAKREGYVSADAMAPVLREAVKAGLVEVRQFRVPWGQSVRLRPHYRYASPGKR